MSAWFLHSAARIDAHGSGGSWPAASLLAWIAVRGRSTYGPQVRQFLDYQPGKLDHLLSNRRLCLLGGCSSDGTTIRE
jgi:hypothetical protein